MTLGPIPLRVIPRAPELAPLEPSGLVAESGVVPALIEAIHRLDDATIGRLRALRGPGLMIVIGARDDLPWADGARWLGEVAPSLYIGTTRMLSLEPQLAVNALARHLPAALLDDSSDGGQSMRLVSLRNAMPLSRAALPRPTTPPTHPSGRG